MAERWDPLSILMLLPLHLKALLEGCCDINAHHWYNHEP